MIVLKIIGWVLLGILALVVIALFVRVGIAAEYSDYGTSLVIKWLFLNIPVYPRAKKKKSGGEKAEDVSADGNDKNETDIPEPAVSGETDEDDVNTLPDSASAGSGEEVKNEKKKKDKNSESFLHLLYRSNGVDGILLLVHRIFSYLGTFVGDLLHGIVVDELQLNMSLTKKNDAAETAIYYGEVCSALFPMMGAIAAKCRIKTYDVNVYPDFLARFSRASFFIRLHITPAYFIGITLVFGCRLVFKVALRMFVKIFLSAKDGKTENSDKKSKEKSVKSV